MAGCMATTSMSTTAKCTERAGKKVQRTAINKDGFKMVEYGYGAWGLAVANVVLFSLFLLFIPFRREGLARSARGIYMVFIVALYAEMYGFPLTIYVLSWLIGYQNPMTHEAGHLLYPAEGMASPFHFLSILMMFTGIVLITSGWKRIHSAPDRLVTDGIYGYIRHPQYLGILVLTAGMLVQWVTIPTAIMWPILVILYFRLAKREEKEMEEKFGEEYAEYRQRVPMFLPLLKATRTRFP